MAESCWIHRSSKNKITKMGIRNLFFHRLHRVHSDGEGQAIVFVALVLFVLICFFALTINVGHRITGKVEMQNAADAAVMSGAIWHARGLNLISIMNVGMTECLALIIMFKAFDTITKVTEIAYPINTGIADGICSATGFCIWSSCLHSISPLITVMTNVNKAMQDLIEPLKKLMKGLRAVELGVMWAAPAMAQYDASKVAELNGAQGLFDILGEEVKDLSFVEKIMDVIGNVTGIDDIYVLLLPVMDPLPVDKDASFKELCKPTWEGGSGYNNFLCWDSALDMKIWGLELQWLIRGFWALLSCNIPPPAVLWDLTVYLHYKSLCTGQDQSGQATFSTRNCKQCETCTRVKQRWGKYKVEVVSDSCRADEVPGGEEIDLHGKRTERPLGQYCKEQPCEICIDHWREGQRYFKRVWRLEECVCRQEIDVPAEDTSQYPAPLVLKDSWDEEVTYSAFTFKKVDDWLALGPFRQGGKYHSFKAHDNTTVAIALAEVYNPTDQDLFNQDWQAKLARCDLERLDVSLGGADLDEYLPEKLKRFLSGAVDEVLVH